MQPLVYRMGKTGVLLKQEWKGSRHSQNPKKCRCPYRRIGSSLFDVAETEPVYLQSFRKIGAPAMSVSMQGMALRYS
jgi:hypothetical protein